MPISNKDVRKIVFSKSLSALKNQAHEYFDMIWKFKYLTRAEAYVWLADQFGIEGIKAHMGRMDKEQCRQTIIASVQMLNDMRRLDLDFGADIKHPYFEIIENKQTTGPRQTADYYMAKKIVTQEDLDANPELVEQGIKIGDEIEIAEAVASSGNGTLEN